MPNDNSKEPAHYDISIVRPQMRAEDFKARGRDMEPARLAAIRKGLLTLHTLELMALNIYKFQLTREKCERNRYLIAAMCNEMTHYQDFQIKIYEFGFKPNPFRWAFWMVGFVFGFGSRMLGVKAIFKTAIWVESKAVEHYAKLLETIDWDDETRRVVEKNQADEDGHISRWRQLLAGKTA